MKRGKTIEEIDIENIFQRSFENGISIKDTRDHLIYHEHYDKDLILKVEERLKGYYKKSSINNFFNVLTSLIYFFVFVVPGMWIAIFFSFIEDLSRHKLIRVI